MTISNQVIQYATHPPATTR